MNVEAPLRLFQLIALCGLPRLEQELARAERQLKAAPSAVYAERVETFKAAIALASASLRSSRKP